MKHFYAILCTFAVVMCFTNYSLAADVWDGTTSEAWTKGTGTEADPYLIETAAQWAYLKAQVAAGNTYAGIYFLQTQDIDLNSKSCSIGTSSYPFSGNYDGGGHEIQNASSATLFDYIKNATIKNLTVSGNSTNSMIWYTYGNCKLTNCHNKSIQINTSNSSSSYGDYAALVTHAWNTISLEQCSNHAPILAERGGYVGGLIAYANIVTMYKCINYAPIKVSYINQTASGLVARSTNSTIVMCGNEGDIKTSSYRSYGIKGTKVIASYNISQVSGMGIYGTDVRFCYVRGQGFYRLYTIGGDINCYAIAGSKVQNCYYAGSDSIVLMSNGTNVYSNAQSYRGYLKSQNDTYIYTEGSIIRGEYMPVNNTRLSDTLMKSTEFPNMLNDGGEYFCYDYLNQNDGYPILKWQLGDTEFYTINAFCQESQGSITGAGSYPNGAQIQLTATPKEHYTFTRWSDGVTDNPRTVPVTADATYVAQFERSSYTVYINQDCSITVE